MGDQAPTPDDLAALWAQKPGDTNRASDYIDAVEKEAASVDPEAPVPEALGDRLKEFARLERLRRRCGDAADRIAKRIARLRPDLEYDLAEAGIQNTQVDGVGLHFRSQMFVNKKPEKDGVTTQMICDCLRRLGMNDLVKDGYSPSSLKSYVKECLEQFGEVPQELANLIKVTETATLVSTIRS